MSVVCNEIVTGDRKILGQVKYRDVLRCILPTLMVLLTFLLVRVTAAENANEQ